ncbi:uncharacterized protein L969DRAFT_94879 [Mixia osmundae IAM 14324]|uniref:FAR1 domain-containing protein n=1 Tax=Mixia osmundae (strain CBS 9802 / IAM 14324 / JCM 22182 / KY 12970) TaxID=764103 RepID=G7E224_MIXOS|nr:uncharacterized protein L969DRAFT_94879 [Mixia osmundae IAM 14324]KEI38681.1 hypothetical protein L969DRAFT_94879 [Mixia osmundae IAM 14324]GAA96861.1 hypothetical protein E5Q_03534 [Mixia osmundae IAM 14324]
MEKLSMHICLERDNGLDGTIKADLSTRYRLSFEDWLDRVKSAVFVPRDRSILVHYPVSRQLQTVQDEDDYLLLKTRFQRRKKYRAKLVLTVEISQDVPTREQHDHYQAQVASLDPLDDGSAFLYATTRSSEEARLDEVQAADIFTRTQMAVEQEERERLEAAARASICAPMTGFDPKMVEDQIRLMHPQTANLSDSSERRANFRDSADLGEQPDYDGDEIPSDSHALVVCEPQPLNLREPSPIPTIFPSKSLMYDGTRRSRSVPLAALVPARLDICDNQDCSPSAPPPEEVASLSYDLQSPAQYLRSLPLLTPAEERWQRQNALIRGPQCSATEHQGESATSDGVIRNDLPTLSGTFLTMNEAIEACGRFARQHGYTLVTRSSKADKYLFLACSRHGKYRNTHLLNTLERQRQTKTRKSECPVEIRGRFDGSQWNLTVFNSVHNHETLPFLPDDAQPRRKYTPRKNLKVRPAKKVKLDPSIDDKPDGGYALNGAASVGDATRQDAAPHSHEAY